MTVRLTPSQAHSLTGDGERWLTALNTALVRWDINTPERAAMFLAQCAHESGGFKTLIENLRYSANALLRTWPTRFSPDEAVRMAYDERQIAERAYGGRMGNGIEGSGDGYRFRGRGIIQLTGRDNYTRCGQAIGQNFPEHPELLEQPQWAAQSAGWFWSTRGCNELADAGDFTGITQKINGGQNGAADRETWLAKVRAILNAPSPTVPIATQPVPTQEKPRMGALIPFLASILPVVFKKFEPRAEAVVAQALGGDKTVAAQFLTDFAGKLGAAVGIPITDEASAVQAVAAVNDQATVKALQDQALDYLDRLADVMQKASALDAVKWTAEVDGKDRAADRSIKERKAGAWDMTPYLVAFAGAGTTLCSVTLLGAIVWQSVAKTIDPVLLGLAGPLLAITFAAWKAIFDYRFDGTKESSDQSKALVAAATKGR
jgi:putative chitinase